MNRVTFGGSSSFECYLLRNATAGSIRAARIAGPAIVSAVVTPRTMVTSAKVGKSSGWTGRGEIPETAATAEQSEPKASNGD